MSKHLKTKQDKLFYFNMTSKDYMTWSKRELYENITDFLKETNQYMDFFEIRIAPKGILQKLYKDLLLDYGVELCK